MRREDLRYCDMNIMHVVKTLTKSLREFKKETILSPVLVTVEVVVECLIPLYMVTMLEKIEADNSIENILFWGGLLLLMAAVSLLFGMLAGRYSAKASAGFSRNLRTDIYASIQGFSFANIDKFSPSSLVTRMTTDVINIQNAFMMIIRIAVRSPIMLVVSVIMSFTINWKIALIFMAVIPVLGVGLFVIFRKVDPIFTKVFKKYDAMNESIQENIKGIRVVKSYVREDYEMKKFGKTAGGNNVWLDVNRTSVFDYYQFWRNSDDAQVEKLMLYFSPLPIDEDEPGVDVVVGSKKLSIAALLEEELILSIPNIAHEDCDDEADYEDKTPETEEEKRRRPSSPRSVRSVDGEATAGCSPLCPAAVLRGQKSPCSTTYFSERPCGRRGRQARKRGSESVRHSSGSPFSSQCGGLDEEKV